VQCRGDGLQVGHLDRTPTDLIVGKR
jgi:hypothetical protein